MAFNLEAVNTIFKGLTGTPAAGASAVQPISSPFAHPVSFGAASKQASMEGFVTPPLNKSGQFMPVNKNEFRANRVDYCC